MPLVVVDLMSHRRAYGPMVVASHHRHTAPDRPLVVVGPEDDFATAFEGAAGIQVTGSVCMLQEDAPWAPGLAEACEDAARDGVPVLGVCFGHQMLGAHFGATLASWEAPRVGVAPVAFDEGADGPFAPGEVALLHTHRDHLIALGPDLEAVATGGLGGIQAFRHRRLPIWGIQGHPEADAKITRIAEKQDVDAWSDAELDTPAAKGILGRFGALLPR